MTKKRGTGGKYSQLYVVQGYEAPLCALNPLLLKALCRVQGIRSVLIFSLLNLTQRQSFLNAPLGNAVAFTASISLRPRPLRACA